MAKSQVAGFVFRPCCHIFVSLTNMSTIMEFLLHYVWQHRLCGNQLCRADGSVVEVIDPGVHNLHSGPDFFNAKIRIDGILWAGNVEIHDRASDWFRHHHDTDPAYNNVVLHVVGSEDAEALTQSGKKPPQVSVEIPAGLLSNYQDLLAEETYPPCYRVIPAVPSVVARAWISRLAVERLEEKTERTKSYLQRTNGDWERTFFVTLARNFGFGTNAEPFEQWAFGIQPSDVGKHRDNLLQIEAFFFGQAGLLCDDMVAEEHRDNYFRTLQQEYAFLRHKFGLTPIDPVMWKFGRLRPQNFPHVRLSQLANLYHRHGAGFAQIIETHDVQALREMFRVGVTPYWQTHYAFGEPSKKSEKVLQQSSLNLILINTISPLLFAYGRHCADEEMEERAFSILEGVTAERNYITRCWERAGLSVECAADSQALIQLRKRYCDRKDCLRCRFGSEYLKRASER